MKNILFILPELNRGGSQNVVFNLTEDLIHRGYKCSLIYLVYENDVMRVDFERIGVRVEHFQYLSLFKSYKNLKKVLRKAQPCVIHSHVPSAAFGLHMSLKLSTIKPIINTVHIKQEGGIVFKLKTFLSQFLISEYTYVSNFTQSWHARTFKIFWPKKSVVYNGVKTAQKICKNKSVVKPINIVTIANLHTYKRFDRALRVIADLRKRKIDLLYHVCGDGTTSQRSSFFENVKKMNLEQEVQFHGIVRDVSNILRKAFVFLLLSDHEMLPMSILESISYGVPVIASNVGGVQEIFEGDLNIGFLINGKNSLQAANYIEMLVKDKNTWRLYSNNSTKRAAYFSINNMTDKYLKIYES